MPIIVEIEGKGVVAEFPDDTDQSVIDSAIKRDFFSSGGEQPSKKPEKVYLDVGAGAKPPTDVGGQVLHGAKTFASGFNEGLAKVLGLPVDIVNSAMEVAGLPVSKTPVAGSKWIKENIMPEEVKPEGAVENVLYATGEQVPGVLPGIGAAARTGQVLNAAKAGAEFAAGAGAASGISRTVAPDNPIIDLAAQIVGGLSAPQVGKVYDALKQAKRWQRLKNTTAKAINQMAEKQAAVKIQEARTKGPKSVTDQIGANIDTTMQLEHDIPGLQFNLGQKSGDPNLLSMARQQGQMPGAGSALSSESIMSQNQALGDYIQQYIRGEGNIDDLLVAIQNEQKNIAGKTSAATKVAESEAMKLGGRNAQDIGGTIREKAQQGRATSAQTAERLYNEVPENLQIDPTPLKNKIGELFGSYDNFTQRLSATPVGPMNRVSGAMEAKPSGLVDAKGNLIMPSSPETMTMKQMKDFRSQMSTLQRQAMSSGDHELAYKAGQLKDGVNEALSLATEQGQGEAIDALKRATAYWRDIHVPTYRQGATGRILRTDSTGAQRVLETPQLEGNTSSQGRGQRKRPMIFL
jgi:hypothetical protein